MVVLDRATGPWAAPKASLVHSSSLLAAPDRLARSTHHFCRWTQSVASASLDQVSEQGRRRSPLRISIAPRVWLPSPPSRASLAPCLDCALRLPVSPLPLRPSSNLHTPRHRHTIAPRPLCRSYPFEHAQTRATTRTCTCSSRTRSSASSRAASRTRSASSAFLPAPAAPDQAPARALEARRRSTPPAPSQARQSDPRARALHSSSRAATFYSRRSKISRPSSRSFAARRRTASRASHEPSSRGRPNSRLATRACRTSPAAHRAAVAPHHHSGLFLLLFLLRRRNGQKSRPRWTCAGVLCESSRKAFQPPVLSGVRLDLLLHKSTLSKTEPRSRLDDEVERLKLPSNRRRTNGGREGGAMRWRRRRKGSDGVAERPTVDEIPHEIKLLVTLPVFGY
jgi:hypothetical protein